MNRGADCEEGSEPACVARRCAVAIAALLALPAFAQQAPPEPQTLSPVVVTGTRSQQRSFDLPMSVDVLSRDDVQQGRARVNVSEVLNRTPGSFVANRENFAQELQISIRGFGARSQFGTRGVKLLSDGLPASAPDGQGSPGVFDLGAAERIEVLRGPFSALYGNHSGGVVQVFSERGSDPPTATLDASAGSYGLQRYALKGGAASDAFNGFASASYFSIDGYRDHSAASKTQATAKLGVGLGGAHRVTVVATGFDQPDAQDPLGLTAAQVRADPRQAQPVALQFDTRRSLRHLQGGVIVDSALGERDALQFSAWVGNRENSQYLAVPLANQLAPTSSGGVSELDRDFAGAAVRWTHRGQLLDRALTVTTGAELDTASEARRGYVNDFGQRGALKRDEDNDTTASGAYIQAEWRFASRWSLNAGVRYTRVEFESADRYITPTNPDDSGAVRYAEWTPTAGVVFSVAPTLNLYASYGRAFETPTGIELAYRPDGASGLNFALQPAISHQFEVGAKWLAGEATRVNIAVFDIRTEGEIVIARNLGGRSAFVNAGDTSRLGAELLVDSALGRHLNARVALTLLNARFDTAFRSCAPLAAFCNPATGANTAVVPEGNRVPGVPNASLFAELAYRDARALSWSGLAGAVELVANGRVEVDDYNSAAAAGYAIANAWLGLEQPLGRWTLRQFARVNNLFDRSIIGAVIVGDANGRYYAPAPTRNFLAGVSATYTF